MLNIDLRCFSWESLGKSARNQIWNSRTTASFWHSQKLAVYRVSTQDAKNSLSYKWHAHIFETELDGTDLYADPL